MLRFYFLCFFRAQWRYISPSVVFVYHGIFLSRGLGLTTINTFGALMNPCFVFFLSSTTKYPRREKPRRATVHDVTSRSKIFFSQSQEPPIQKTRSEAAADVL